MKKWRIVVGTLLICMVAFAIFILRWFTTNQVVHAAATSNSVLQDFIGDYYEGDGLGVSCSLSIQPDRTFSFRAGIDMGRHWEYGGTVVTSLDRIQLISIERALFEPHDLLPVKWGDRRYSVASDNVSDFCEWINEGWEPRNQRFGIVYLRVTDWEIPAKGRPTSPQGELMCP